MPQPIAAALAVPLADESDSGGFHAPTVDEFFPPQVGEFWWSPTRINLIGLVITLALCVFFVLAFRRPAMVPGRLQTLGEMCVDFVRVNIVEEILGAKGKPYTTLLLTMFWMILALNITGVIPFMNIAVTSVIGVPLMLALISYVVFNTAGIKEHGVGKYLKMNLFPPGVPAPIYLLVTPIEFISTFILRPVTLTIRLMANMMAGHLLLVLFFSATSYFLFEAEGAMKLVAIPSYAMGFAFTLFEVLVAVLQAYIFTLLTAVYIDGAVSHEH
jgi:F-type H+-transporting ATPase subunit a